jgi:reactive intermediate/imine deaminase
MNKALLIAVAILVAAGLMPRPVDGTERGQADLHYLNPPDESAKSWPFSDAVMVGDLLFVSGKLGIVPGTRKLAEGGIQAETRQTMENIKASVERYGGSMERAVKCTVFLADIAEWGAMNEVYVTYFPEGRRPARSALGASGLALDARVEIECIFAL